MSSFPFVRHHFLRAGFEVIDCPPLTAQLKNSSDIRMVMDVRDILTHDTYFDEFIILSGDADFTPVLHRLRAHARRTVIFRQRLHGRALYGDLRRRGAREPTSSRCSSRARSRDGRSLSRWRSDPSRPRSPAARASRPRARRSWPRSSRSCARPPPRAARGAGRPGGARPRPRQDHRHRLGRRRQLPRPARQGAARGHPPERPAALLVFDAKRAARSEAPPRSRPRPEARTLEPLTYPRTVTARSRRRPDAALASSAAGCRATRSASRCCAIRAPRPGAARSAGPGAVRSPLGPAGATSLAAARLRSGPATAQPRSSSRSRASRRLARRRRCRRPSTARCSRSWRKEITDNDLIGAQTLANIAKRAQDAGSMCAATTCASCSRS